MKTKTDLEWRYKITVCKQALRILGKTQSDLSRDIDLHRVMISKFFTGKPVTAKTARRIIEALGLRVEDVIIKRSPLLPDMSKRRRKSTVAA